MDRESLVKQVTNILGVSSSESDLGFELFLNGVLDVLDFNEAIKIPDVGVFQLKREVLTEDENKEISKNQIIEKDTLLCAPVSKDYSHESGSLFLPLDVTSRKKNALDFDESVFSIGAGKPIIPLAQIDNLSSDSGTTYMLLKKSIEERVNELISTAVRLPNFNLWDNYLTVIEKEEKKDEDTEIIDAEDTGNDVNIDELNQDLELTSAQVKAGEAIEDIPEGIETGPDEISDTIDLTAEDESIEEDPSEQKVDIIGDEKIEEEFPEEEVEKIETELAGTEFITEQESSGDRIIDDEDIDIDVEEKIWRDALEDEELKFDWGDNLKNELLDDEESDEDEDVKTGETNILDEDTDIKLSEDEADVPGEETVPGHGEETRTDAVLQD